MNHLRANPYCRAARAFLLGASALALSVPVSAAADTDDLERQLRELQEEVQRLKEVRESERVSAPANAVTAGDIPGSFKLPGTDTSIAIGGYAKGDVIVDIDHDLGDTFAASLIPVDGAPENTTVALHARQSRLNLTAETPTEFGTVRAFVEGDFFGGGGNEIFSNSRGLRLRHAYGEFGPLLVGQTWTLFMPLTTYPDTVDFFGPAGIPFIRQAQVRYTHELSPNLSVAVSAENPQLTATTFDNEAIGSRDPEGPGLDTIPDFVGALEFNEDGLHFRVAGLIRNLKVDDESSPEFATGADADDSEIGWGIMGAAAVPVLPTTTLNGNFAWGEGIGRYIINGFAQDAFISEGGSLETVESWGFAGSINHAWTAELISNFVYGRYKIRDRFFDDQTKSLDTFHVNTWWEPFEQARFGVEYIHGRRNFEDGNLDNTANRVQFGAQYFF